MATTISGAERSKEMAWMMETDSGQMRRLAFMNAQSAQCEGWVSLGNHPHHRGISPANEMSLFNVQTAIR